MDAKDIRNLQEAYLEVVSNDLNEMSYKKLPVGKMMWKAVNRTEREADTRADREREANDPHSTLTYDRAREEHEKAEKNKERNYKMVRVADTHSKKEAKAKSKLKKEQVDLYDIILSHLLDEGYAETPEQAEVIMVNMSEDWVGDIVEATATPPSKFNMRRGLNAKSRRLRRSRDFYAYGQDLDPEERKISTSKGEGGITKNPKKLRKQKAMGELKDSFDLYDIILSHLINEGYAETPEQAEVIMVNMSEGWRESIVEAIEGLRPASERMARGVLTSSQRASQKARARREEKKKEELEKAANAILNQIGGASRRSSAPMGSTPAPQKAEAPEANRRIKPRMKSDDLASAADKVLRSLR